VLIAAGAFWIGKGQAMSASEEELAYLMREGREWVNELRAEHRPGARRLEEKERRALEGFFPEAVLEAARVKQVQEIVNPAFFSVFEESGKPPPIDFSRARAMALRDTVIVVESRANSGSRDWLELLFHELVHCAQFFVLGEEDYYRNYVQGWAAAGERYRGIPIEEQAYSLASRYRAEPDRSFSVEWEVREFFSRQP